jgi:hypothetical protein
MKQKKSKPAKSRPAAPHGSPADRPATKPTKADIERRLDEELADTFPASDPPSILRGRSADN